MGEKKKSKKKETFLGQLKREHDEHYRGGTPSEKKAREDKHKKKKLEMVKKHNIEYEKGLMEKFGLTVKEYEADVKRRAARRMKKKIADNKKEHLRKLHIRRKKEAKTKEKEAKR